MPLGQAFGEGGKKRLPACNGNRPWLADHDAVRCEEQLRVLLRGASNAYFAVTASALSIPPFSDPIQTDVGLYEDQLAKVDSLDKLENVLDMMNFPELTGYDSEQIWDALRKLRGTVEDTDPAELRWEEYQAFVGAKGAVDYRSEFKVVPERRPDEAGGVFDKVMRAVRLREVRALRGFTRVDSIPDIGEMGEVDAFNAGLAPIAKQKPDWLPGVELRGEGIFITMDGTALSAWEGRARVDDYGQTLLRAQKKYFDARAMEMPRPKSPRFVLVHSLAHLLIRRLELEAGYSGSSLRERIYSDQRMAGFLIYTATPDSEGTLGGLVELARPEDLGPILGRIWEDTQLCANDPFCASRKVSDRESHLNGAACHACLLLPETSCEQGNHYLDRSLVVRTLGGEGVEFVGV